MPGTTDRATSPADLLDRARRWAAEDPDAETVAELTALVDAALRGEGARGAAALTDIADRFAGRLEFGTAGLRGEIGAGPRRMNRVVVMQAAAGLARHLIARAGAAADPAALHVVIGYDGRTKSDLFAEDSARVLRGYGIRVSLMPRRLPTPVLAFAVRALDADAGIMVTASHNPPRDNGYKVYLGGSDQGSQLVSPADGLIAAEIAAVAAAPLAEVPLGEGWQYVAESVIDDYIARTAALAAAYGPRSRAAAQETPLTRASEAAPSIADPSEAAPAESAPAWVYTPLHGVGAETFLRTLQAAGIPAPVVVAEQGEPDPRFPTVDFPNPEEPGALDLAVATAAECGAELVIAHDPDADRLAVAVASDTAPGGYERLSGNELGSLLGWASAVRARAEGRDGRLGASLVSSPALGVVAAQHGLGYEETLTGFKWISRVPDLIFGYEEALGYLVNPETVRDKDGLSAAVAFLSLAARLREEGVTLARHRADFAARFGVFRSGQVSLRFSDVREIEGRITRLAEDPPAEWAGAAVVGVDDFRAGYGDYPPSDILRFRLADGSRVIARPSGTEPKLKVYLDVREEIAGDEPDPSAAGRRADARLAALDSAVRESLGA